MPAAPAPPMRRFSPGLPITLSASGGTAYPAAYIISDNYGELWHSESANPTMPVWAAINVNGIMDTFLQNVYMRLDFQTTGAYTSSFGTGGDMTGSGVDWKVRGHASLNGGVVPVDGDAGWVDIITVTANTFSQRLHVLGDCRSYKWIEVRFTAKAGSNGLAVKVELFGAPATGLTDSWLLLGDSTTEAGALDVEGITTLEWNNNGPIQRKVFVRSNKLRFPLLMGAGSGGQNMNFLATNIAGLVAPNNACTYYAVCYGLNDANQSGALTQGELDTWQSQLLTVVDHIQGLGNGRTVIVSYVQFSNASANGGANAIALNLRVDAVRRLRPATLKGPDLYTVFQSNQALLSADGLHPGYDTGSGAGGYNAWQAAWRDAMFDSVYAPATEPNNPKRRRVFIYLPAAV